MSPQSMNFPSSSTRAPTSTPRAFTEALEEDTPSSSSTYNPKPPNKMSRYSVSRTSACERCRVAKARCSQERPTCARCLSHSLVCVYDRIKSKSKERRSGSGRRGSSSQATLSPEGPSTYEVKPALTHGKRPRTRSNSPVFDGPRYTRGDPLSLNDKLASKQELWQLLNAYFTYVYPVQAMSFIHKSQLFRRVDEGGASPLLIKAMCAVSARFLPNADRSHAEGGPQPSAWCQEAKIGIILDTDRFSLSKLAAILCILTHEFNCGRTGSAWIFVAMAVRMARAMSLNIEGTDTELPFVERETRRRLIWAIFCADCFCSAGLPEYMLLSAKEVHVYLPCDENSFVLGIERPGERLEDLIDGWKEQDNQVGRGISSLMTRWIWLMALRANLLRCERFNVCYT